MEKDISDYEKRWEEEYRRYMETEKLKAEKRAKKTKLFYQEIGRFIQKHRERRNLSQTALGRRIGCSIYQIAAFENARSKISLYNFGEICNVLGANYDCCGDKPLTPEEKEWVEILRRRDTKSIAEWLAREI